MATNDSKRHPYEAPCLEVLGTVEELTLGGVATISDKNGFAKKS